MFTYLQPENLLERATFGRLDFVLGTIALHDLTDVEEGITIIRVHTLDAPLRLDADGHVLNADELSGIGSVVKGKEKLLVACPNIYV